MADPLRPSIPKLSRPGAPGVPGGVLGELQSEVAVEATPLLRFVLEHARSIAIFIVILVAAVVAVGVWHWNSAKSEREAQLELGRILIQPEGRERLEALERFLATAPVALKSGIQLEIAATALALEDMNAAAKAYGDVYASDSKGALGMMAAINQADILSRAGKFTEALAVLDAVAASAPEKMQQPVRQAVQESQAAVAEQAGQLARALAIYEDIIKQGGNVELGYYQAKAAELKARLAQPASAPAPATPVETAKP